METAKKELAAQGSSLVSLQYKIKGKTEWAAGCEGLEVKWRPQPSSHDYVKTEVSWASQTGAPGRIHAANNSPTRAQTLGSHRCRPIPPRDVLHRGSSPTPHKQATGMLKALQRLGQKTRSLVASIGLSQSWEKPFLLHPSSGAHITMKEQLPAPELSDAGSHHAKSLRELQGERHSPQRTPTPLTSDTHTLLFLRGTDCSRGPTG